VSPREPVIRIDGLVVRAESRTLLSVPRLQVQAGERVALVGHNGAGKSTLLRALAGFVTPTEGTLAVLGRRLPAAGETALPRAALRALRAEVGPVMQGLHLVPRLTARENVLIGALARVPGWRSWARLYPPDLIAEADAALATLGLAARAPVRADRLSGGERQKVAIARLQLQRPRLILADEPTAALDPSATEEACRALQQAAEGATLVSVVHQPALLPLLSERVIGLHQGRVIWDLPVGAVDDEALARVYGPRLPEASPQPAPALPNAATGRHAVATR
jgi:phosphonate transport system ATP-binding protein